MEYENLFIDTNLPETLTKEELYKLFKEYKDGNLKARDEIINQNIRLVLSRVWTKYLDNDYKKKDLVSIGLIGLIKSVDTFDINKNYDFSTYAIKCIDNEILQYFRKNNKTLNNISLNKIIVSNSESNKNIELKDILEDKEHDIVTDYEEKEIQIIIRNLFNELPENQKTIIGLYFSFYNNKKITQHELAKLLNVSQAQINKLIKNILKELKIKLETTKIIELSPKTRIKKT